MTKAVQSAIFFINKPNSGKTVGSRGQVLGGWIQARFHAAAINLETDRTRIQLARRKPCFFFDLASRTSPAKCETPSQRNPFPCGISFPCMGALDNA
ncbi:hypothetical protein [Falsochrobactrum shanghaiense]|uniref:hypothetical protein n=1 Tax=Falsochrobactrum shanghaiense TaxID=2201899 RepID=UPI001304C46E|nr:hypothetical protein [Falsochrobactrum shanghaiense]